MRTSPELFRRLTMIAMVSLVVIVATGAAVRLTGSGLGCSDWPTCEDNKLVAPGEFHPMIEFLNRIFTGVVSLSVVAALVGAYRRIPRRRDLTRLSWGLVLGVGANALLGGLTVLFELKPIFVIGHFLLSMLLLWNVMVLWHRAEPARETTSAQPTRETTSADPAREIAGANGSAIARVRPLSTGIVVAASVVLVGGTVVTGTGPNGGDEEVERLALSLRAVAQAHSIAAWVLVALITALAVTVGRGVSGELSQQSMAGVRRLLAMVVAQGALGYLQYFSGVPALLVFFHVVGAALIWLATIDLWLRLNKDLQSGAIGLSQATGTPSEVASAAPTLR